MSASMNAFTVRLTISLFLHSGSAVFTIWSTSSFKCSFSLFSTFLHRLSSMRSTR